MSAIRNIIFCGGGSGGHVMPAVTLYKYIKAHHQNMNFIAIGSFNGIEKEVFTSEGLSYFPISTGKLRRYFSWENFTDILKIMRGIFQAFLLLGKWKRRESVIVATGGFVTVPVVVSAWLQRKKIIVHEQTSRVGLANKICSLFADHIIVTFEESLKYFPAHKVNHLGYPLREEIFEQKENSLVIGGSDLSAINRPILFLTGGGNGSKLLNDHLLGILNNIKDHFFIVHQCGKNFESELKKNETENYKVFGFVGREMIELMKRADVIISRAGAGTVVELIALGKPSIFIPLKHAQKNEQFHNAMEANHKIGSIVIEEVNLSEEHLLDAIDKIAKMEKKNGAQKNPIKEISDLILS